MQIDYTVAPPPPPRGGVRPRSVAERFWEKVKKTETCWIWTGGTRGGGYGELFICRRADRTSVIEEAHAVSWVLHGGVIPVGHDVCHKCDNPPCVNPEHLFTGTRLDNMGDAKKKGRIPSGDLAPSRLRPEIRTTGERNGCHKLTAAQVLVIRARYAQGVRSSALAREYGIGYQHVWQLVTRRRWAHL